MRPEPRQTAVPPPASMAATVEPTIHVSGCSNETVSNIIQGMYTTKESNHGKPVYKKEGPPGSVTVLIYYWDDRDGPLSLGCGPSRPSPRGSREKTPRPP
mmetsp:Transcript_2864/g.3249  ORF Transcript_2864/g.3249 Transcript_2864/m.3249 type:complete len:100 (-) Transcript_2864:74-373(-)